MGKIIAIARFDSLPFLSSRFFPADRIPTWKEYVVAWLLTGLLPFASTLTVVALVTGNIFFSTSYTLPFMLDHTNTLNLLATLPAFVLTILRERSLIPMSINSTLDQGSLAPNDAGSLGLTFVTKWQHVFSLLTISGFISGCIFGGFLCQFFQDYASARFWRLCSSDKCLHYVVWSFWMSLFFGVVMCFIFRRIGLCCFLSALSARVDFRIQAYSGDKCGGLRPLGQLSLNATGLLVVGGINLAVLTYQSLLTEFRLMGPTWISLCVYAFGSVTILFLPLLPLRRKILAAKKRLSATVVYSLKAAYDAISNSDVTNLHVHETVKKLETYKTAIESISTIPFSLSTTKHYIFALVSPEVIMCLLEVYSAHISGRSAS